MWKNEPNGGIKYLIGVKQTRRRKNFTWKGILRMDKHTFSNLVLQAETTLYHIAKSILANEADCEDAVQDAVLAAYKKLDSLRDEKYFKTWLVRILINTCYRRKKRQNAFIPYAEAMEHVPDETADYNFLYQALLKLDTKFRLPVVLHYIEGYSVEEIKGILKIPAGTVKSRLSKGRTVLRTILKEETL